MALDDLGALDSDAFRKRLESPKLWNPVTKKWETAVTGTEYLSPNQQGGIYGVVYRQYFTTSLPSSLTSGSNVTGLIDYSLQIKYTSSNRGLGHGNMTAYGSSDNHAYIMLSGGTMGGSGNLSFSVTNYSVKRGWVDYTK